MLGIAFNIGANMYNYCVYLLYFPNGTVYVGRTRQFDKRIDRHYRELRDGNHHNVNVTDQWIQFKQFNVTRIDVSDEPESLFWEDHYINYFRSKGCCLNIGPASSGGDNISHHPRSQELKNGAKERLQLWWRNAPEDKIFRPIGDKNPMWGKTHTEEARAKISASNKGKVYRKGFKLSESQRALISEKAKLRVGDKNPFFGKTHSEEVRKKSSERMKGHIPLNRKKVSINGIIYDSLHHASKTLKIPVATVLWRVNSKNKKFNSYSTIS